MNLDDPEPVEEIYHITDKIIERAGGSGSEVGTGGMLSKIRAAEIIIRFGEKMVIANARTKNILNRILDGEKIGTIFVGKNKPLTGKTLAGIAENSQFGQTDGAPSTRSGWERSPRQPAFSASMVL